MRKLLLITYLLSPLFLIAQGPYCTLPANYYNGLDGLSCNALKSALFNKISTGYVEQANSAMWELFEKTDKRRNDANTKDIVWDMYTDRPTTTGECEFVFVTDQDNGTLGNAECQKFNREHTIPQSWFNSQAPMVTDLFEVYPVDKYLNAQHDNFPYGEVNPSSPSTIVYGNGTRKGPSAIAGITGTVFEPIDEYKGDLARTFLYMATRYHDQVASWDKLDPSGDKALDGRQYPAFEIPFLKMLLKWHHEDPVSQKEINRNNAIYCFQKNRNPYIDKPELADLVWNPACAGAEALPVNILYFKGAMDANVARLTWEATSELNFDSYVVERSQDGNYFAEIGSVPGSGQRNYQFNDQLEKLPAGRFYYRLKLLDKNGSSRYSAVVALQSTGFNAINIFPNPAVNLLQLYFSSLANNVIVEITDMAGRKQLQQRLGTVLGKKSLSIASLVPGSYMLRIISDERQETIKLQVIR